MPIKDAESDVVEIAKRNGDFRKNYGTIVGAYLYLRTVSAAVGRPLFWSGSLFALAAAGLGWLQK